jgi:hypothetical protein
MSVANKINEPLRTNALAPWRGVVPVHLLRPKAQKEARSRGNSTVAGKQRQVLSDKNVT